MSYRVIERSLDYSTDATVSLMSLSVTVVAIDAIEAQTDRS